MRSPPTSPQATGRLRSIGACAMPQALRGIARRARQPGCAAGARSPQRLPRRPRHWYHPKRSRLRTDADPGTPNSVSPRANVRSTSLRSVRLKERYYCRPFCPCLYLCKLLIRRCFHPAALERACGMLLGCFAVAPSDCQDPSEDGCSAAAIGERDRADLSQGLIYEMVKPNISPTIPEIK